MRSRCHAQSGANYCRWYGTSQEIMSNSSLMEANGLKVPHSLIHDHRDREFGI